MDSLMLMSLAAAGIIGWIMGAHRKIVWAMVGVVPAVLWLVVYFVVELARSQPELIGGTAQMSLPTVIITALGIVALITDPTSKPSNGGPQSA